MLLSDLVTGKRIDEKCAGDSSSLQEWRMLFFGVLNDAGYQAEPFVEAMVPERMVNASD